MTKQLGLEPAYYLENFNSYDFLDKIHAQFKTGPCDTNIMDLRFTYIPG